MFSCDVGRRKPHVIEEVRQLSKQTWSVGRRRWRICANACHFDNVSPFFLQKPKEQQTLILCNEPGCLHPPLNVMVFSGEL
jgi:hypothetical protein